MEAGFPGPQMNGVNDKANIECLIFQAHLHVKKKKKTFTFLSEVENKTELFFPLYRSRREAAPCIGDDCLSVVAWGLESQV